jgi:hypothetical protein
MGSISRSTLCTVCLRTQGHVLQYQYHISDAILLHCETPGAVISGGESLLKKIKGFIIGKEALKEIPRMQGYIIKIKPSLEDILRYENKKERGKAIFKAHIRYGYTLKEIAEYMGVHYTTLAGLLIG